MLKNIFVTLLVHDIEWDTDGDEAVESKLPTEVPIQVDLADIQSFDCINHQICEYLSEEFGWLISGYKLKGCPWEAHNVKTA
jgi:hypothetical protein